MDGAILTCTNCTKETVWVPSDKVEVSFTVEESEDIDLESLTNIDAKKVALQG